VCVCVLQVIVSHVADSEDVNTYVTVYLQQSDRLVQLEQLLDRLDDSYSASDDVTNATATYRRGDVVAVRIASVWQRATLLCDVGSDDAAHAGVKVHCVDFGSVHDVDVSDVRTLHAELMSEPMFAVDCQLFGVTSDSGMISNHVDILICFVTAGPVRAPGL